MAGAEVLDGASLVCSRTSRRPGDLVGEQVVKGVAAARTWDLILRATGDYLQKRSLTRALV